MPEKEEEIAKKLKERFDFLEPVIQRARRIWVQVPREKFLDVIGFLHSETNFTALLTVTGLDCGDQFQLIYYFAGEGGIVLCVKEDAPKTDPVFETATNLYRGGVLYELEAHNLLGLTIRGIPDDIRYPLPDHWPQDQYPLRKDWTQSAGGIPGTTVKEDEK
ncbi:MAG: NADH-quinone oxidoreductase subunit C [Treponema sp.]|nr:NADH-quinone oxidoreductase subunit C [Treponema sp.]